MHSNRQDDRYDQCNQGNKNKKEMKNVKNRETYDENRKGWQMNKDLEQQENVIKRTLNINKNKQTKTKQNKQDGRKIKRHRW